MLILSSVSAFPPDSLMATVCKTTFDWKFEFHSVSYVSCLNFVYVSVSDSSHGRYWRLLFVDDWLTGRRRSVSSLSQWCPGRPLWATETWGHSLTWLSSSLWWWYSYRRRLGLPKTSRSETTQVRWVKYLYYTIIRSIWKWTIIWLNSPLFSTFGKCLWRRRTAHRSPSWQFWGRCVDRPAPSLLSLMEKKSTHSWFQI